MKHFKKNILLIAGILLVFSVNIFAQKAARTAEEEAEFKSTLQKRAEKIVKTLGVANETQGVYVQEVIAQQYWDLNEIHDQLKLDIKAAKEKQNVDQDASLNLIKKLEKKADAKLDKLHNQYLAKLGKELTPQQIDQVKDGMTYGVLPITYNGYLDMIPNLTDPQKAQIMEYLVEAREHAMDAGSSDEKHKWFGKYKGKINNYLSAQGYDLKKEGEAWEKRRANN